MAHDSSSTNSPILAGTVGRNPPMALTKSGNMQDRITPHCRGATQSKSQNPRSNAWAGQDQVKIRFKGFPFPPQTRDVWEAFHQEGSLNSIDLFQDSHSIPDGGGDVWFRYALDRYSFYYACLTIDSPPPRRDFWNINGGKYIIRTEKWDRPIWLSVTLMPFAEPKLYAALSSAEAKYPENMVIVFNKQSVDKVSNKSTDSLCHVS